MIQELKLNGFEVKEPAINRIELKGIELDCDLRFDILVEDLIIVEIKAAETIHPVWEAQILSYMKLLKVPKGILLNFNCQT